MPRLQFQRTQAVGKPQAAAERVNQIEPLQFDRRSLGLVALAKRRTTPAQVEPS